MKNVINYYYLLNIDNIYNTDDNYYFTYLDSSFLFKRFFRDTREIDYDFDLISSLNNNYFHKIIKNKDNMTFSVVDDKVYVLLKLSNVINDKISIYDLHEIRTNIKITPLNLSDWPALWQRRADYLEYLIEHIEVKYNNVMPTFYFFLGLVENAIKYVKDTLINIANPNLYIEHRRLDIDSSVSSLYDPLNLVIDYKVRDISEYLKSMFFKNRIDLYLIEEYLFGLNLTKQEYQLLMGRMMFATFFFDNLDNIKIIEKISISDYIDYLNDIYDIINKKTSIKEVSWILNN